jgi:hypothetical protein
MNSRFGMKVFLDSWILIRLLDGHGSPGLDEVRDRLCGKGHQIAITPTLVFELAAPLSASSTETSVMRRLIDLESLPTAYLADGQIARRELFSAIQAFDDCREYVPVDPYVERFDAAIPLYGPAPTALHLHHGLPETVLTIWQERPELFRAPIEQFRALIEADRKVSRAPSLAMHFREKLRRDLSLYGLSGPRGGVNALADWIYECPDRCPGTRLNYEVYHHLRRNVGDQPEASDFGDFAHVRCTPYVDLVTLDRRMADYVRRSGQGWPNDQARGLRQDLSAILQEL